MADKSSIEWTDATWNPVRGCSRITTGCGGPNHEGGCYAEKIAARFSDPGQPFHGFAERTPHGGRWTGKLALIEEQLTLPLRWKKPRRIFVNSMSDLFHESLPDESIDRVFAVMALAPQHTFQVLTKRAERMRSWINSFEGCVSDQVFIHIRDNKGIDAARAFGKRPFIWPLPNVWLGVSAERQEEWDERGEHLRNTPAAVTFVSAEPLLGPIRFHPCRACNHPGDVLLWPCPYCKGRRFEIPDWVIVGGESGPRSRANWVPDVRSIVKQCQRAGVAVFVKQLGANVQDRDDAGFEGCSPTEWPDIDPACVESNPNGYLDEAQGSPVRIRLNNKKGGDWSEWPEDLRVRQFPDRSVTERGSASSERAA